MKTIKLLLVVTIAVLLINCSSKTEEEAFKEIGALYNSEVTYSKGISTDAGKSLTVIVKGGDYFNEFTKEEMGPNCARIVYKHLSEKEREKYARIIVQIHENATTEEPDFEFGYNTDLISKIQDQSRIVTTFSTYLTTKMGDAAYELLAKEVQNADQKKTFINTLNNSIAERDGLKKMMIAGVNPQVHAETKERMIQFVGVTKWGDEKSRFFSLTSYEDPQKDELIAFNIK